MIAVFGALTMYAVSMGAFFRLRRKEPLLAALFCYNPLLGLVYVAVMAVGIAWFRVVVRPGLGR